MRGTSWQRAGRSGFASDSRCMSLLPTKFFAPSRPQSRMHMGCDGSPPPVDCRSWAVTVFAVYVLTWDFRVDVFMFDGSSFACSGAAWLGLCVRVSTFFVTIALNMAPAATIVGRATERQ